MEIAVEDLKNMVESALLNYGYESEEIKVISDVLLYAQLRDNNQGISKLIGKGYPKDQPTGEIEMVQETAFSSLLNGNSNPAMIVLNRAVDICLEKARESRFAIVGTYNTSQSTGAMGYYARRIALADHIGFAFAGAPPAVCPYGAYEPVFGTNPIAVAIPSGSEPIVLDMATSAMARYGLIEARFTGRSIPDDIAYDIHGEPTTDPAQALEGAIRPFDRGHKGSGLAMIVEILTGPLVSASFGGIDAPKKRGNLVIAIGPGSLVDVEEFKAKVSELVKIVKESAKLPGVDEVFVPGEKEERLVGKRLESGRIDIEDELYEELKRVVDQT